MGSLGIPDSRAEGGLMLADIGGLGVAILIAVVLAALATVLLVSRPRPH
jgi:hypothetical protein